MTGLSRTNQDLQDIEQQLLLEAIFRRYGFDFREYSTASIHRRILGRVAAEKLRSISGLQERLLHDPECMERLLLALTVHVTSMFRDPAFYVAFRQKVVPLLKTYPFVRIWHAGCSTGEEVYSMAMLVREEGLAERCRIYATDLSEAVLKQAKAGVFPLAAMKEYTENYHQAGGTASFSEYYTARFDHVVMRSFLKENIVFAEHNLVTDSSFNEFNVILCRNVLIYFNKTLQKRVHGLLYTSLARFGVLALGRKESLRFTSHENRYEVLDGAERLYRRVA
ncbi:MAG: protein-glutamate O-methyltransferase CheR [Deltaproteobacteria bacterium]|nr:protein-glutamate O-methyltransferase CheR [Deltaproteobacteria bacterium]